MKDNDEEIKTTYEIIDGKEVPVYRIPTGMSSAAQLKIKKDYSDYEDYESEEDLVDLDDEQNTIFYTDEFIE